MLLTKGHNIEDAFKKLEDIMTREGGVLEWSDKHQCLFTLNKFGLMGFTHKRAPDHRRAKKTKPVDWPCIKIHDNIIEPKDTHKFLGFMIDQELQYKVHAAYALRKGTKWIEQYKRLEVGTKGISAKYMKQFYYTVALPKMLYAADLFLIPESSRTKGTIRYITKMARCKGNLAKALSEDGNSQRSWIQSWPHQSPHQG
jgi:hypothetical protein